MCRGMYFVIFAAHVAFIWAEEKECSNQQATEASDKGSALLQMASSHDNVKKLVAQLEGLGDSASDVQAESCDAVNISLSTEVLATDHPLKSFDDINDCAQKGIEKGCRFVLLTFKGHCGCYDKPPCNTGGIFNPNAHNGFLWTQPCPTEVTSVLIDDVNTDGSYFYYEPWKMACLVGSMDDSQEADVAQMRNGKEEWSGKIKIDLRNMHGLGPLYGKKVKGSPTSPWAFNIGSYADIDYWNGDYSDQRHEKRGQVKFGECPCKSAGIGNRKEGGADGQWQAGDTIVLKTE